jgi:probable F420-dependent oxidoreductase
VNTKSMGKFGVWARPPQVSQEIAVEIESLGYGTLWIGGSPPGDLFLIEQLLDATSTLVLATGIVNVWSDDAPTVAHSFARVEAAHSGRFLLGIGIGHHEHVGKEYDKPYAALVHYLDKLDAHGVPADRRVLAALGPHVLRLAADRTAGAHPYLTTPEHTRAARDLLGPEPLLAPEHKVVVLDDAARAREIGRRVVHRPYLGLSNYVANLRRLGYTDDDLHGSGSDRLVDDLVAHGSAAAVAARVSEHLAAGADQVALQVIPEGDEGIMPNLRALAPVLF